MADYRRSQMPFNSINDLMDDHWEIRPGYPVERGAPNPLPELNKPLGYGPNEDMQEHERTLDDIFTQRRNPLYGERHAKGGRIGYYRDGGFLQPRKDEMTGDRGRRFFPHEMHQTLPAHPGEYNLGKTPRHWNRKPWQFYSKAADGGRQNLSPSLPFWDQGNSQAFVSDPHPQAGRNMEQPNIGAVGSFQRDVWPHYRELGEAYKNSKVGDWLWAADQLPKGLRDAYRVFKESAGYAAGGQVKQNPFGEWSDIEQAGRMNPALWSELMVRMQKLYAARPDLAGKVIPPIHEPQSFARTLEHGLKTRPGGKFSEVFVSPTMAERDPKLKSGILPPIPGVTTPQRAGALYNSQGVPAMPAAYPRPSNVSPFTARRRSEGFEGSGPAEIKQFPRRVPINQGPVTGETIVIRPSEKPPAEILPRDIGSNPEDRMNWWDRMRDQRNNIPPEQGGSIIDWPPKRQFGGRIGYADGGMPTNPFDFSRAQDLIDAERVTQSGGPFSFSPITPDQARESGALKDQYNQLKSQPIAPSSAMPPDWLIRGPSEPTTDKYSQDIWASDPLDKTMAGGIGAGKIRPAAPYGAPNDQTAPSPYAPPKYSPHRPLWMGVNEENAAEPKVERQPGPAGMRERSSGIFSDTPMAESTVQSLAGIIPDWMVTGPSGQKKLDETNEWLRSNGLPYSVRNSLNIPQRPDPLAGLPEGDKFRDQQIAQRKQTMAQGIFNAATGLPVPPFYLNNLPFEEEDAIKAYMKGDYGSLAGILGGVGAPVAGRMLWPIKNMASSPIGRRDPEGFFVRHNFEDDPRLTMGQPSRITRDLMPVDTSRWEVRLKAGSTHPELSKNRKAEWEVFETPTKGGQSKKVAEFNSQHWGPGWHGNQQWLEINGLKPVGSHQITSEMLKTIQPQVANIYPQSKGFIDQNFRIPGASKKSPEQFVQMPARKFEYYPDNPYVKDIPGGTIPGLRHQNPFSFHGLDPQRYRFQRLTTSRDPYARELYEKHALEKGMPLPEISDPKISTWERMQNLMRSRRAPEPETSVSPLRVEQPALSAAANAYPKPPSMLEIDQMARKKGISRQEMVKTLEELGVYTAPKANGGSVNYARGGSVQRYAHLPFWETA